MAIARINSLLTILLFSHKVLALQVTPNSPCASACLDNPSQDVSDPNTSNTYSSDIVCLNSDYDNTSIGRKFESCVDCLQTSTAQSSGEDDQSWFLYNLRFALNTCLFSSTNASDAASTPCSTDTSCGPLQRSIDNGDLVPSNESTYSYCSANNNALLGASLPNCISCLQDVSDEYYLANFLIALQAGCIQQPPTGTNIGIRGNLFSSTRVNVTYPGDKPASATNTTNHKKGLTQAAVIGIAVGLGVLLVIATAVLFICYRKRRHRKTMERLTSPLDARFGSKTISSPNEGAYGNPYASPPTSISHKFDASALSHKELRALGLEMPNFSKPDPNSQVSAEQGWQDAHAHLEATQPILPSYTAIPTHQAYIPAAHAPISPADSTNTTNTYQVSSYASSRSSPKNPPPPIKVPQKRTSPAQKVEPSQTVPRAPAVQKSQPSQGLEKDGLSRTSTAQKPPAQMSHRVSINTKVQAATGLPHVPTPQDGQLPQFPKGISLNTKVQASTGLPRVPTPQDGVLPQFPPRAVTPQQTHLPQFPPRQEMTSQMSRPALHSQQHSQLAQHLAQAQQINNQPPSRSHSIAESWKRSGSRGTVRESSTERTTAGGWKRSGSRGTIRDESRERPAAPVRISGPMIRHGARFDFESAEKEMREREEKLKARPNITPSSADSEEQWPGTY